MLIQFSVRNFKTFRDKATLSMVASNYDKETREADNVIILPDQKLRLLKSAVVYGANASGKTKLFEALGFVKNLARESANEQKGNSINVDPFRLSIETAQASSEFEVTFLHSGMRYRYGFEVLADHVVSEWLYYQPKNTEVEVFYREAQQFIAHARMAEFRIGKNIAKEGMVKENTLWLSAAAKWNDAIAGRILEWFEQVRILSNSDEGYAFYIFDDKTFKAKQESFTQFVRAASIGMEAIVMQKVEVENPAEYYKLTGDYLNKNESLYVERGARYPVYDANKNSISSVDFSLQQNESAGTNKYFALSAPVLNALEEGCILVIDELDSRLHPNLVCSLISLFNDAKSNPNNAQLIFNTHDTNLLSSGLFRRDQIWFTEKDRYGAASLYSLSDFSPRKGENLEKNYIQGKYGAVPYLGDFENLIPTAAPDEK